jgi:hypothetical protein
VVNPAPVESTIFYKILPKNPFTDVYYRWEETKMGIGMAIFVVGIITLMVFNPGFRKVGFILGGVSAVLFVVVLVGSSYWEECDRVKGVAIDQAQHERYVAIAKCGHPAGYVPDVFDISIAETTNSNNPNESVQQICADDLQKSLKEYKLQDDQQRAAAKRNIRQAAIAKANALPPNVVRRNNNGTQFLCRDSENHVSGMSYVQFDTGTVVEYLNGLKYEPNVYKRKADSFDTSAHAVTAAREYAIANCPAL